MEKPRRFQTEGGLNEHLGRHETATGPDLSVGTVGDAYDNALAECVIGLFKTEVINQIGPWNSMREVEWETLKWVDWYNNRHLLGPIGYITPAETEEAFYANLNTLDMAA